MAELKYRHWLERSHRIEQASDSISSQTEPELAAMGLHNQLVEVLALEDAPYVGLMDDPLTNL